MAADNGWASALICFDSPTARLRLIASSADRFGRLGPPDWGWFFADVSVPSRDGERACLEVAIRRVPGAQDRIADLSRWIEDATRAGLVAAAGLTEPPLVLQPRLFPGARVPGFVPPALSIGSHRAAALLRAVADAGFGRAPDRLVREELDVTYRSLIPDRGQRRLALDWHATWLEAVDGGSAAASSPDPSTDQDAPSTILTALPTNEYRALRGSIGRELSAIAARLPAGEPQRLPDALKTTATSAALRAVLIARLAHIQALRLWGPDDPDELRLEAALIRALADEPRRQRTRPATAAATRLPR